MRQVPGWGWSGAAGCTCQKWGLCVGGGGAGDSARGVMSMGAVSSTVQAVSFAIRCG